ncbi:MAG: hypothetical protein VKK04_25795 [Synechococcales bacterium]|nr:hypothetical protein [Synechococcales bacterium]
MTRCLIALASALGLTLAGGGVAAQSINPSDSFAPSEPASDIETGDRPSLEPVDGGLDGDSTDLQTEPAGISSPSLSRPVEVTENRDRLSEVAEELQFYDFDATIDLNSEAYSSPGPAEPSRVQFILE